MRARRPLAAGLLVLFSGLAIAVTADRAEARVSGVVTLNPEAGPASTVIEAQFQQATELEQGCGQFVVIFKWDGHAVGQDRLSDCVATATFKPPRGYRMPGTHRVTATDDKNTVLGLALFIVEVVDPSGSPSSTLTPSTSTSAAPSTTSARTRSPKPTPGDSATDLALDPPLSTYAGPTLDTTAEPALAPPDPAEGGSGGTSSVGMALAVGGVLVLAGVTILGFIVFRGRREEPQFALAESPTEQIPTYPRAFAPPGGAGRRPDGRTRDARRADPPMRY
jgi:hypothetical protein